MPVDYLDQLPAEFVPDAVRLLFSALGDKLVLILGNDRRARDVLGVDADPTHCIAAIYKGQLVGMLAFKDQQGGFLTPTLRSLRMAYGLLGGLWRILALGLSDYSPSSGELYVDGVAVAESMRGKGIGSRLFATLERIASKRGSRRISLAVVDTNPQARALYERLGFVATARQSMWPWDRLVGLSYSSVTMMTKDVG
jgi:ribosomal protein S18 acetylase RimI-like enzyme